MRFAKRFYKCFWGAYQPFFWYRLIRLLIYIYNIFAIIYILCLIPVAKGVFQFFYLRSKSKSYIKTKRVVVGNHVDSMDSFHAGGYTYYYPIVEYQNAEMIHSLIIKVAKMWRNRWCSNRIFMCFVLLFLHAVLLLITCFLY